MGKFTVLNDSFADSAFEYVINEVIDVFFSIVNEKHIKAIFLIGGAGRGEAGIYFSNNQYWFVNDLDFLIIPSKSKKPILKSLNSIKDRIDKLEFSKKNRVKAN